MKILLIKLTSLGDLIHALPALSDALAAYPNISFDWLIDENFSEIATWHPAVNTIYRTNHRAWGKKLHHPATLKAIIDLIKGLREMQYDLIIDGQGNFKSSILSSFLHGPTAGFDKRSVREWIAPFFYQRHYAVSKQSHAIDRLRRLFALACDYALPTSPPDFHIDQNKFLKPSIDLPKDYALFIHNASWKTKLWPEKHWEELVKKTIAEGLVVLLPWGNAEEKARALRLSIDPRVLVLPKLTLSEMGYIISRARICVAMDTGLAHLAAALSVPCITLYGATHAGLSGTTGPCQVHLASTRHCSPCKKKTCRFSDEDNPCLAEITPESVYSELLRQANLRYL